jgi:hypothetical protein
MIKYPYLLPNLVSAMFLISSALVVILGLEEVSRSRSQGNQKLIFRRHITFYEINETGVSTLESG